MHKFSELVKFNNDLSASIKDLQIDYAVSKQLQVLNSIKKTNPNISYNDQLDEYSQEFSQLLNINNEIIKKIQDQISSTELEIDQLAKMLFDTADQKDRFKESNVSQTIKLTKETTEYINTRIGSYCDYRYPGLVVYPREKKWVTSPMVACDPLYIVEHNSVESATLIEDFEESYINRLRFYTINNRNFNILPQQQFKFILLWDFLNYISVDQFDHYLREMFKLLRPGGTLMVSYNNCDLEDSAQCAELNINSYANVRLVKKLAIKIGFEVTKVEDLDNPESALVNYISWAELSKPGELKTTKSHQALAQILGK